MTTQFLNDPTSPEGLAEGEKLIVSAHTGGVLVPDSFTDKRQHLKALREDHTRLNGHHTYRFSPVGDGGFTIRHTVTGRFVEPLRKTEEAAVYENIRFQGPILLETGPLSDARNVWDIRPTGHHYQLGLRGSHLVIGLTHPDHMDSWVTLVDPWWSTDRLWLIHDAE
ncbi:hypothetical protein [Streptomyces johnsoniae]|uniref:Uncharacterized protein n=1 Tax=Streptomyces johnsoniae TaxID=3075532 RepID=A0ABU2RZ64_9ACTN|nr:hypothetical protein [Streptomyces sp. DSM 41886]MDT0442061.1 hypothetical protein [Streptomyces sp. DSM 41886]